MNIVTNALFASSGIVPVTTTVSIPSGDYSFILVNVTIRETGGPQYDRPIYVFANGIPLFWGSTQEIFNSTATVDVTYFENLLQGNVTFQIVLINYLAPWIGITGVYYVNATLYLYPGNRPAGLPNYFIPLFLNQYGVSLVRLNQYVDTASQSVNLPIGTYRMFAYFYSEGLAYDEFWYTNVPAFGNILVYYNNYLAGVVYPYPVIYTGGIDLFYWRPITSINTLAFHSNYFIDLTPMLALGSTGTIAVKVTNLQLAALLTGPYLGWFISGALLLWVDPTNPLIGGKFSSKSSYYDSGPILIPYGSNIDYIEYGSFSIQNVATLRFSTGTESSSFVQTGSFSTHQTLAPTFQSLIFREDTRIVAQEKGFYNAKLSYSISYPLVMRIDFNFIPIDNPNVIPYRAKLIQTGFIDLYLNYQSQNTYQNYDQKLNIYENVKTSGGFSLLLLVINPYGGAIVIGIDSNYAHTIKSLDATYLVNNKGWREIFYAESLLTSPSQRYGQLIAFSLTYQNIG